MQCYAIVVLIYVTFMKNHGAAFHVFICHPFISSGEVSVQIISHLKI